MRRVTVNIDSLILKGFRYEDRHAIAAAVEEEISRALSTPDAATRVTRLGSIPHLRIGNVNISADMKPQQIGAATGRAAGQRLIK